MRCNACNVDLGEEYTVCPLCGEKASAQDAKLKNIETAGYPKYAPHSNKFTKPALCFPQKYFVRVSMILCILLFVLSFFNAGFLFEFVVPAILIINAVICFVCAFFERGKLLHSGVALLSVCAFSLVFFLLGLLLKLSAFCVLGSLLISLGLFILLFVFKPERLKFQLQALFSL